MGLIGLRQRRSDGHEEIDDEAARFGLPQADASEVGGRALVTPCAESALRALGGARGGQKQHARFGYVRPDRLATALVSPPCSDSGPGAKARLDLRIQPGCMEPELLPCHAVVEDHGERIWLPFER